MGREIRRVIPNWEHPKREDGSYQPMYNETYKEAADDWIHNFLLWQKGEHPDQLKYQDENEILNEYYWEWAGMPPHKKYYKYYLPETEQEKTWYQAYETVSEGTPVTPPFATKEELIDYLVDHGDFWDQQRGNGGWSRENAQSFVEKEWAPTMIIKKSSSSIQILTPRDDGV